MKKFFKTSMIVFVIMLSGALKNESTAQASMDISFQTFYDDLSPYGQWINYPEYGYVWSPDHSYNNFRPYSSEGRWVWSDDYGWFWASDYDWGWAPFHYGRWLYDSYYGWLWVPDYDWSPAWVVWRGGGDYYGWAPMQPGISINLYFGNRYSLPYDYWCFAPRQYITSPRIYNYCEDVSRNRTIINNTTIINNYRYSNNAFVTGPSRNEAERYTGSRIGAVSIHESGNPGRIRERNNEIDIYRPSINRQGSANAVPKKFERYSQDNNRNDRIERGVNGTIDQSGNNNRDLDRNRERQQDQRTFRGIETPGNRPDARNNDIQRPQPQVQPQGQRSFPRNEIPNRRQDIRNDDVQRPQPQEQRSFPGNERTDRRRDIRNNDVPGLQPQSQPQEQRSFPGNGRTDSRPDIRNNEVQRPQPQSRPQIENRIPEERGNNGQGQRGSGQQNNRRGGREHN